MKICGPSHLSRFPTWICFLLLAGFAFLPVISLCADLSGDQQKLVNDIEALYNNRYDASGEQVLALFESWQAIPLEDTALLRSLVLVPGYQLYKTFQTTREFDRLIPVCEAVLTKMRPFRELDETEWYTWYGRIAESYTYRGETREGLDRWYQLRDSLLARPVVDSFFIGEVMLQVCREAYYQRWLDEGLDAGQQGLLFLNGYDDSDMYSSLLLTLGRIYRLKSEYVQAITHFRRAVDILETIPPEERNRAGLTIPYVEIAQSYESQGKIDLSISFYEKAVEVMEFPTVQYGDQIAILGNLTGSCRLKYPERALGYLDQALDIYELALSKGIPISITTPITLNIRKGRIFYQLGQVERARSFLKKQVQLSEREELRFQALFGANVLTKIALEEHEPETALIWWQKGYESFQGMFNGTPSEWEREPDFSVFSPSLNFVTFLTYRGQALIQLASSGPEEQKELFLSLASKTSTAAQEMLFEIRRNTTERSQGYNDRFQELQALKLRIELSDQSPSASLRAFSLMDHSKVLSIQEDWVLEQRRKEVEIDPQMATRLNNLEREIIELETLIFDQQMKGASDSIAFQNAYEGTQLLVRKRRALLSLEDSIEIAYPDFRLSSATLPQVTADMVRDQLLASSEAVVSFFYSSDLLFWSVLTSEDVAAGAIPITDSLSALITEVILHVRLRKGGEDQAMSASVKLYNILFSEMNPLLTDVTHVKIIPDGPLVELPFEALVVNPDGESRPEYLLDRFAVSYWLSARSRWILEDPDAVRAQDAGYLASFAPEYPAGGEALAMMAEDSFVNELVRAGEFELPGALQEASVIADMWNGQVYKGAGVTEEEFLQEAGNFSVLHLAMHALVEKDNEDFSRLLFAPSGESGRGFLSAMEIAEMDLPAEMVVLSACNTGKGEWRAGEGVFHLGRAFRLAGVRSMVMSLWQVPDRATSEMMPEFYRQLKDGQDKSMALRAAKLAYLDQAEPAFSSPYYWAGFVMVGDEQPLPAPQASFPWSWLITSVFMLLLGFLLVARRKSGK